MLTIGNPLFKVAGTKLLNFNKITQKLHGPMGYSIKQIYSLYSDTPSGLLN